MIGLGCRLKNPQALRMGFREMAKLRGTTTAQELKRNGKIITRYCMKGTPPFLQKGGLTKGAINQSWNLQKRTGEKAVKRDIDKVFIPIQSLGILKNPKWAKSAQRMIRNRDLAGLKKLLGQWMNNPIIIEATEEILHKHQGRRGRVKIAVPYLVLRGPSISALRKLKISHVGQAKAGWVPAARALGETDVPGWVTGHNTPGSIREELGLRPYQKISVANLVRYGESFAEIGLVDKAIGWRTATARRELREITRANLKKGMKRTGLGR